MNQVARITAGPEGYMTSSAALRGVVLADPGYALVEGEIVEESQALAVLAKKLLQAEHPVIFPGPLVLWDWKDGVREKARLIQRLAQVSGSKIIPMPDYRPKYPKINPEIEINPNHPNLTIWHNAIDVCIFVGVHCHYANVALKIIRAETPCYTAALCADAGHEDAMISIRDLGTCTIEKLIDLVQQVAGGSSQ